MSQHEIIGGRARRDSASRAATTTARPMSSPVAVTVFDRCRSRVDELFDAHVPMDLVERMIDAHALEREDKDALWLWASARRDRLLSGTSEHPIIASTARDPRR
jgi:hypothetical protein